MRASYDSRNLEMVLWMVGLVAVSVVIALALIIPVAHMTDHDAKMHHDSVEACKSLESANDRIACLRDT